MSMRIPLSIRSEIPISAIRESIFACMSFTKPSNLAVSAIDQLDRVMEDARRVEMLA